VFALFIGVLGVWMIARNLPWSGDLGARAEAALF
jgi:hypothetical protein